MTDAAYRFDRFVLDPADRVLRMDGAPVDLNGRYLDALALLVGEQGRLITKARFHDEVWRGVPVTDEALTQCIRTLRSRLGDDAGRPRFIETVPKHGYRFIADVTRADEATTTVTPPAFTPSRSPVLDDVSRQGRAGMIGGGVAGLLGGLIYGFVGAGDPQAGGSALSAVLVVASLAMALGLLGGAGVSFGIAASAFAPDHRGAWGAVGGAAGGLIVGAVVKLIGLDAFDLLFGQAPEAITGAPEGAMLGGAVGLGAWIALRRPASLSSRAPVAVAGLIAAAGGALIALSGGRLLGGSLDLLAGLFPGSRLRLDPLGALFGEVGFGPVSQTATAALEGLLFGACVVAAMRIAAKPRSAPD